MKQSRFRGRPVGNIALTLVFLFSFFSSYSKVITDAFSLSSSSLTSCGGGWQNTSLRRKSSRIAATTTTTTATTTTTTSSSSVPPSHSTEDLVEFPPAATGTEKLKRAAKFWSSAVPIVLSYFSKSNELRFRESILGERIPDEETQLIWEDLHEKGAQELADVITSLKGFYVKTAQIIASRQDLFPRQYTEALSGFTDNLDPMPASLAKAVVEKELLHRHERFEDVFSEFDEVPLGSASVAQVHRAVLTPKYGGPKEVAIKIQRPSIESKLMGDIANLKALAKPLQNVEGMPMDYYTVFSELEVSLQDEFNFVAEAAAMDRIYQTVTTNYDINGNAIPCAPPLVLPRPIPNLVSKRVLVMDYLKGVPLSRARDEMIKKGIDPDGPEAELFGRKLLRALTDVFGRCILESGFFHADPHPGNIFVLDDGSIGLIDFGQVKQISGRDRITLAEVMVSLADRESDTNPADLKRIGNLALQLGVEIKEDAQEEGPAAVAMWLFDGSVEKLPGGYDTGELSPNSPVKELKSFPQDLVLVGRSSILIKGLSNRLNIPWSLAKEWSPIARRVLSASKKPTNTNANIDDNEVDRLRFRTVTSTLNQWWKGKSSSLVMKLPSSIRSRIVAIALKIEKRKEQKQKNKT